MLKVGIYFESTQKQGGAHQQNIKLLQIFDKFLSKEFDLKYIISENSHKEYFKENKHNVFLFKKDLIFRVELFLYKFPFFREIYKKLKLRNKLEKFLLKKKFDLIFFNSPSESSILLNKLNFVIMLLSMQHRTHGFFPEYKGLHDNEIRDIIIENAVKKSFKIFVGALKDKTLLEKFYNINSEKIIVQPYAFTLPKIYEANKNYNFKKKFNDLNLPNNKNIFIYPAQFWAHKNHKYIVDVAKILKEKKIENIHFVFSGYDKGNKNYITKLINENKLNNFFTILNFIDDFELIALYLNCFGVLMPSFVGHTTIPMYESFYFKKNIFYTEGLSDNSVKNYLTEIDLKKPESFINQYMKILGNKEENNKKLNDGNQFLKSLNIDETIANNFIETFKEYNFFKNSWK